MYILGGNASLQESEPLSFQKLFSYQGGSEDGPYLVSEIGGASFFPRQGRGEIVELFAVGEKPFPLKRDFIVAAEGHLRTLGKSLMVELLQKLGFHKIVPVEKKEELAPGFPDSPISGFPHPLILLGKNPAEDRKILQSLAGHGKGLVRGAVIDKKNLEGGKTLVSQALQCFFQIGGHVVGGDDYGNFRIVRHEKLLSLCASYLRKNFLSPRKFLRGCNRIFSAFPPGKDDTSLQARAKKLYLCSTRSRLCRIRGIRLSKGSSSRKASMRE